VNEEPEDAGSGDPGGFEEQPQANTLSANNIAGAK